MKAYMIKKKGELNATPFIRIFKGNEFVFDRDSDGNITGTQVFVDDSGAVFEKIGGPVGGVDIVSAEVGKIAEFIEFRTQEGKKIQTESQLRAAYEEQLDKDYQARQAKKKEAAPKFEAPVAAPVAEAAPETDSDSEVEASGEEAESAPKPRRGRPPKTVAADEEVNV